MREESLMVDFYPNMVVIASNNLSCSSCVYGYESDEPSYQMSKEDCVVSFPCEYNNIFIRTDNNLFVVLKNSRWMCFCIALLMVTKRTKLQLFELTKR